MTVVRPALVILFFLLCTVKTTFAEPAKRVISLAPHATELAYAAGLGEQLIAVSEMSDYPQEAQKLEKIANYKGIKLERIIALQPDLIIAWPAGNPAKELEKLRQFGFHLYESKTESLADIANNIEQLSQYSANPQQGREEAARFRSQLNRLSEKYRSSEKVRYFYQLSEAPIITVAGKNWPSEVFTFCGGENIFANAASPYPQVSVEQVVLRKPQAMFASEHAMRDGGMWDAWRDEIPALQNGHSWQLNADWLNRPTPRTLLAIEQVCEHFATIRGNR